jgi:hypothetical protein
MLRTAAIAIIALSSLAPGLAEAQRAPKQTTFALIRCESPGGRESFCPADTRRGVQITRTLQGRCQLGRSWGYDATGIWVRGCSAEFEIGNRGGSGNGGGWGWGHSEGSRIVCASENFRYSVCEANTRGGVRLVNQISRAECVEGRSWGSDRRGIWVDQGCAGEFEVSANAARPPDQGGNWGGSNQTGSTFLCESRDGRRRYCDVDLGRRSATVIRNISRVPCEEGDTWGIDRRGLWVDGGCRAEFRIIDTGSGGARPPIDRPQPGGGIALATLRCESKDFRRTQCTFNARDVRRVELTRQTSRANCVEGRTWGWQRGSVWVDQGCAGDFTGFDR